MWNNRSTGDDRIFFARPDFSTLKCCRLVTIHPPSSSLRELPVARNKNNRHKIKVTKSVPKRRVRWLLLFCNSIFFLQKLFQYQLLILRDILRSTNVLSPSTCLNKIHHAWDSIRRYSVTTVTESTALIISAPKSVQEPIISRTRVPRQNRAYMRFKSCHNSALFYSNPRLVMRDRSNIYRDICNATCSFRLQDEGALQV